MIVYHGTHSISADNILKNGIDVTYGEESVDNGRGFYTTPGFEFAKQRAVYAATKALGFYNSLNVSPAILKLDISFPILSSADLTVKTFDDCSFIWKQFVFYNRLGKAFIKRWGITSNNHNLDNKFDIVYDETADSHISAMVSDVIYSKDISCLNQLISRVDKANLIYWDKQISFHSVAALRCINSIELMNIF